MKQAGFGSGGVRWRVMVGGVLVVVVAVVLGRGRDV